MDDKVIVRSYDGKLVSVPIDKKDEYLKLQDQIKMLINSGKTKEEVLRIINDRKDS